MVSECIKKRANASVRMPEKMNHFKTAGLGVTALIITQLIAIFLYPLLLLVYGCIHDYVRLDVSFDLMGKPKTQILHTELRKVPILSRTC